MWSSGAPLPELPALTEVWPRVFFTKLLDDPAHRSDPQSLEPQGDSKRPRVVVAGLALVDDDWERSKWPSVASAPALASGAAHLTVLFEPAVVAASIDASSRSAWTMIASPTSIRRNGVGLRSIASANASHGSHAIAKLTHASCSIRSRRTVQPPR